MNRRQWIGAGLAAGGLLAVLGSSASATAAPILIPGELSKSYDTVFRRQCPAIPVEYLRALAYRESRMVAGNTSGAAWGLLEVVQDLVDDYNKVHGTSYSSADRLNPEVNARIACDLLATIVRLLPGFSWSDPRQVNLLTFAWNAGWSRSTGVVGVVEYLIRSGMTPSKITIDMVRATAEKLSWTSDHLKRTDKVAWCKTVTALYFQELKRGNA